MSPCRDLTESGLSLPTLRSQQRPTTTVDRGPPAGPRSEHVDESQQPVGAATSGSARILRGRSRTRPPGEPSRRPGAGPLARWPQACAIRPLGSPDRPVQSRWRASLPVPSSAGSGHGAYALGPGPKRASDGRGLDGRGLYRRRGRSPPPRCTPAAGYPKARRDGRPSPSAFTAPDGGGRADAGDGQCIEQRPRRARVKGRGKRRSYATRDVVGVAGGRGGAPLHRPPPAAPSLDAAPRLPRPIRPSGAAPVPPVAGGPCSRDHSVRAGAGAGAACQEGPRPKPLPPPLTRDRSLLPTPPAPRVRPTLSPEDGPPTQSQAGALLTSPVKR